MTIAIYYFSGTGNTAWVVGKLAETLRRLGDTVTLASCEDVAAESVDPGAWDKLGLVFPTHSSFAPRPFREFMRDLPPGNATPLFAIASAGYWAGDTAWYAVQPLRARGYAPFLFGSVIVSNNFYIPPMDFLPVTPPERMPRKLAKAARKIDRLAQWIHDGAPHTEGTDVFGRLLGLQQRWSYATFEKRLFKPFYTDENCTRCGWCVRYCPVHNISLTESGVVFGDACFRCMRCYSFCPARAIQATEKTRNLKKYRRYAGPEGRRYPV